MTTWTNDEDLLLVKLYNEEKLDLLKICSLLKKKCKEVIQRLIDLKIVEHKKDVRGYSNNNFLTEEKNISVNNNSAIITSNNEKEIFTKKLRDNANIILDNVENIYNIYNDIKSLLDKFSTK